MLLELSDDSVKQILIWQNEQLSSQDQFIIMDLDSRHLLVKTSEVESIEMALNTEVSDGAPFISYFRCILSACRLLLCSVLDEKERAREEGRRDDLSSS